MLAPDILLSRLLLIAALAWTGAVAPAQAGPPAAGHRAHVHGQAELDFVLDDAGFEAELRMPMDSLVGFERAPASEAERQALDQALATLKDPDRVLRATTAARCTGRLLAIQTPKWREGDSAHADVEARYRFDCAERARLMAAEVVVFEAFSRLRRIDTRSVDAYGARSQRLGRNARVAKLSR